MTPELSVVIPCYRSRESLRGVVDALRAEFRGRAVQYVLVDDGNADGTQDVCAALARENPDCVTAVRLTRNFGEHNAVMAGLRHAAAPRVIVMDDDGQHSAADAARLERAAREGGLDLVYSQFSRREHPYWRVAGSALNGLMARWLLGAPAGLYLSSFKCLSARVAGEVARYDGPFPYVDALALKAARGVGRVEASHHPRLRGSSGYTLGRLLKLWLSMTTHSAWGGPVARMAAPFFDRLPYVVASVAGFRPAKREAARAAA